MKGRWDRLSADDLRLAPAYTLPEAAHYLRMPVPTLRSWVLGRPYPAGGTTKNSRPLLRLDDPGKRYLSFTKDTKFRRNPLERAALCGSGARVFVITDGEARGADMASLLIQALPQLVRVLRGNRGPLVAPISKSGVVGRPIKPRA